MHNSDSNGGNYICVYNKARGRLVATRPKVADGFFTRLVGLLGTTRQWARPGQGLWLLPSHGVHTFGMRYPLDLIFLNRDCAVVDVQEHVRPFRISKVSFKADSVLELPVQTVFRSETRVGDQLEISQVRASR